MYHSNLIFQSIHKSHYIIRLTIRGLSVGTAAMAELWCVEQEQTFPWRVKKKSTRPTASVSAVIHWSLFTGRVEGVIVLSGIHRLQKENHKKKHTTAKSSALRGLESHGNNYEQIKNKFNKTCTSETQLTDLQTYGLRTSSFAADLQHRLHFICYLWYTGRITADVDCRLHQS